MNRYVVFDAAYSCREYLGYVDADDETEAREILENALERGGHSHKYEDGSDFRLEVAEGTAEYLEDSYGDFNWAGNLNELVLRPND